MEPGHCIPVFCETPRRALSVLINRELTP